MKQTEKSFYAMIWIGGDYAKTVQSCREFCMTTPLCVTVTPTAFVYVSGMQDGVCVRLINYPRFPATDDEIRTKAVALADHLLGDLCQESYSIEYADHTEWTSTRAIPIRGVAL